MNGKEIPYAYVLLAGTILSMFLVHEWSTYQEIVLTFSLAFFALSHFDAYDKAAGIFRNSLREHSAVQ